MSDLSPRTHPPADAVIGRRRNTAVPAVVIAVVLLTGGLLVAQFLRSAVDYYCNVDEIGQRPGCDAGRRLRLQGVVVADSLSTDAATTEFAIAFNGASVPIRYAGTPGGIFRECIPVVVHGTFDGDIFASDRIEVKHSEEYVAANDDRLSDADALASACRQATP